MDHNLLTLDKASAMLSVTFRSSILLLGHLQTYSTLIYATLLYRIDLMHITHFIFVTVLYLFTHIFGIFIFTLLSIECFVLLALFIFLLSVFYVNIFDCMIFNVTL